MIGMRKAAKTAGAVMIDMESRRIVAAIIADLEKRAGMLEASVAKQHIPDLAFKVVRVPATFVRAKYVFVFLRTAADGKPYIDDLITFPGSDGRKARSEAIQVGHCVYTHKQTRGLRDMRIMSEWLLAFKAAGVTIRTEHDLKPGE
jgi:hypothetical protein